jgi:MFS family permease
MIINQRLQYKLLNRNTFYSYIDGIGFCIMLGATFPYIGLYILRFGGSPDLVNWAASLQPIIMSVVALLGASYAGNLVKKKPALVRYSLILRLSFFWIAFVPFLSRSLQPRAFFGLWLLAFIPWGICGLLWSPMISTIIPEENQGRFLGYRNALNGIASLIGTFLTGLALSKLPFSTAFTIIFLVSFGGAMISLFFLNKHREPLACIPHRIKKNPAGVLNYFRDLDLMVVFKTFQHPEYGYRFFLCCLAVFIFHIGFSMTAPLYTLRLIKQLDFTNAAVATIATATSLTGLFGSYTGGIVSGRWGYRYVLLFSTLLATIPPVIWALSSRFIHLLIASMIWGFIGNAYTICFFYMVLAVSPTEGRSGFVAMNSFTGNTAAAVGPFLGMILSKIPALGIQGALIGSSIIMLMGAACSYRVAQKGSF